METTTKESSNNIVNNSSLHYPELLLRNLNDLRSTQELCDVILCLGDKKFYAHKVILAGSSPYFRAMFTGNLAERNLREVELKSVDEMAIRSLIDFIYTGKVSVNQVNVQSLLPAACLMQMKKIVDECCAFLKSQLHPSNCIGITKFAELHACHDLHRHAEAYLLEYFEDIANSEEFLQLTQAELIYILSHDDLKVSSEEIVFHSIEAWVQHNLDVRQNCLAILLKYVRLPLLPVKFLAQCFETNDLVRNNLFCQELFNEALKYHFFPTLRLKESTFVSNVFPCTRPRCLPKILCAAAGKNGLFATLDSVELYLPDEDTWTEVNPLPSRRLECGLSTLDGKLYIIGGMICTTKNGSLFRYFTNSVERWTMDKNTWTSIASMTRCRSALGVASVNQYLYAIGGYTENTYHRSVERYNSNLNIWESVCSMNETRCCFGTAVVGGMIYAAGGYGPPCLNSLERYDPRKNSWELLSPMLEKRFNFGMVELHGFLFAVGGHDGKQHLSSMERYDPHSNQWTSVTGMNRPRTGLSAAGLNGYLYAAGGHSGSAYLNIVQRYDPYNDRWCDLHNMNECRCSFGLAAL